jgi:DNA-binding NtrC family response regulator
MFNYVLMVVAFVGLFLNLFLGLLALTHSGRNPLYKSFFLMNAVLILWNFSYYATSLTNFMQQIDVVALECAAVLLPAVMLHFIWNMMAPGRGKALLLVPYAVGFAWCGAFIITDVEIWSMTAALVGASITVIGLVGAVFIGRVIARTPRGAARSCFIVVAVGCATFFITGAVDYLLCFIFDLYLFVSLIGSLIFSLCVAWAIFTYEILNLRQSIKQAVWAATLFLLVFVLHQTVHSLVEGVAGMEPLALVVGTLVIAYLLSPLGPRRLREMFHSLFFPDQVTLFDIMNRFVSEKESVETVSELSIIYLSALTSGVRGNAGVLYLGDLSGEMNIAGYCGSGSPLKVSPGAIQRQVCNHSSRNGFKRVTIDGDAFIVFEVERRLSKTLLIMSEKISQLSMVERRFLEILTGTFATTLDRLKGEAGSQPTIRVERECFGPMIGGSAPMQKLYDEIERISPSDATVLIHGESGSGKELVARMIHDIGARRDGPFVAVNCATLTGELLLSELFGHERGSFTGAIARRIGCFERALGGTLFLDEIGEVPPATQAVLLRVLEEKSITRVGGAEPIPVDVRIVVATNVDLASEVEQGGFRGDLFYRLNVIPIDVPALRDRPGDIPQLVDYYLTQISEGFNKGSMRISEKALSEMVNYPWHGNVRELANILERAVLVSTSDIITHEELNLVADTLKPVKNLKDIGVEAEREALIHALKKTNGNVTHAAKILCISRVTLQKKMKKYKLRELFD